MDAQGWDELWPPKVGDYARVRQSGALGEVVDIACTDADVRYTVNILSRRQVGLSECHLEDLLPVWPVVWKRPSFQ
jgi:hypothetical protein